MVAIAVAVALSIAAASPYYGEIAKKISELISGEIGFKWNFERDLRSLQLRFEAIQAALKDGEGESTDIQQPNLLHNWLKNIKGVSYDMEDLLDDITLMLHRFHGPQGSKIPSNSFIRKLFYCACLSNPVNVASQNRTGRKMKEIRKMMDEINSTHSQLNPLIRHTGATSEVKTLPFGTRHVPVGETSIFGRDAEKNDVINKLSDSAQTPNTRLVSVVAIVGSGGSGKTTFASLVYNDDKIQGKGYVEDEKLFNALAWVSVSPQFEPRKIVGSIIEAVSRKHEHFNDWQTLLRRSEEVLNDKKVFLVMDDVWNEDRHKWDLVMTALEKCKKGSKILVTTRSHKVAGTTQAYHTHDLKPLSAEDSWKIFCSKAFDDGEEAQFTKLQEIGEGIVKNCNGIPLAINALGAILYDSKHEDFWIGVRDSKLWKVEDKFHSRDEQKVTTSLKLTYLRMPPELRRCFTFCSFFPKDYELSKEDLIRQWIALGFISHGGTKVPLEEISQWCFQNLVWSGLLRTSELESSNKESFKMHDLAYELAQSIVEDEITVCPSEDLSDIQETCRYAYFQGKEEPKKVNSTKIKLRALRSQKFALLTRINAKYLRMLILEDEEITEATLGSLKKSKHMRYLHVSSSNKLDKIPEKVTQLPGLQVLKISKCSIRDVPEYVGKLKCLRMLDLSENVQLNQVHDSIGQLTSLQTLNLCSCGSLTSLPDAIGELESLRILDLRDCVLLNGVPVTGRLKSLQTLNLCSCRSLTSLPDAIGELESLQILDLRDCVLLNGVPAAIIKLKNLQKLDLTNCEKLAPPPQGIEGMNNLDVIITANTAESWSNIREQTADQVSTSNLATSS